jgi:hypothetical protein
MPFLRSLFLVIVFHGLAFDSFSQEINLEKLTKQELEKAKTDAIKSENYSLAHQINLEISKRKTIDEYIVEVKAKLAEAKKLEDYKLAADYKSKLEYLELNNAKLKEALAKENYILAQEIKTETFEYLNGIKSNGPDIKTTRDEKVNSDNLSIQTTSSKEQTGNKSEKSKTIYTASLGLDWMRVNFSCESCTQIVPDYDSKTGYFASFGIRHKISDKYNLSIDPEIGLATIGWSAIDPNSSNTKPYEMDLFNLRSSFTLRGEIQNLFLYRGGLGLDYILKGTNTLPSGTEINVVDKEVLQRLNTGLIIGSGLNFGNLIKNISKKKATLKNYFFELNFDYFFGFNNVEGKKDTNNGERSYYNHFRVSVKSNF